MMGMLTLVSNGDSGYRRSIARFIFSAVLSSKRPTKDSDTNWSKITSTPLVQHLCSIVQSILPFNVRVTILSFDL